MTVDKNLVPEAIEKVDPVNADIKQIISDVFSISGLKISADDPIVAILLYQKKQLAINRKGLEEHDNAFFINLDQRFQKISQHYEEMQNQKNIILTELMQKNERLVKDELQKQKPNHETVFFVVLGILVTLQFLLILLTLFKP
ncbi:hypothetical protein JHL22_10275 [Advenella sp. WQ 585]|uniref:Uncharacterized protein n=1 Tax=Advenella mandrilli TaxID=2800330 RepID=A0ABS1EFP3_9BURK|nr:hypothetical protein [Advenella mandrilli]MBK1781605.1 hypothetical protein [Advenella mandrilli]